MKCLARKGRLSLIGTYSWEDVTHHSFHVRFVRQYVPSDNRHRFSLKSMYSMDSDSWEEVTDLIDYVSRGSNSAFTVMGYGRTRAFSKFDSFIYP